MQGLRTSGSGSLDDPPFGAEGRAAALRSFLAEANHRLAAADSPLEELAGELANEAPRTAGATPRPVALGSAGGLWVLWRAAGGSAEEPEPLDRLRRELGTFVEVERGEQLYFGGGLPLGAETTQALRRGDEGALPDLLSLTRTVSGADLVYLGSVHEGVVEVEWHLGAEGSEFGFELPVGEGIGGRVSARDATTEIPDYRNCQYRHPEVSDITDGERARSILAVPVHGEGPSCGAVLYAVRREVVRFSPAQRSLVQRISRSVEPVPGVRRPSRRLSPAGHEGAEDLRAGLRRILGQSNKIQDVETWMERTVGGPAILVDHQDRPYLLRDAERFEQLKASGERGESRASFRSPRPRPPGRAPAAACTSGPHRSSASRAGRIFRRMSRSPATSS